MKMHPHKLLLLLPLLLAPALAVACIVKFRPAEELKSEAKLVLRAVVVAKQVAGQSAMGELYTYQIELRRVERGSFKPPSTSVTYYNLRAVERGGVIDCPLKDGSGLETALKIGSEYRLFLKDPGDLEILFSEAIKG